MVELAREVLAGQEAWIVGGAVRDELLGRPVLDLDVACADPEGTARAYARRSGGAPFPLSERHGAWRVALEDGRTVDFTPVREGIEADLATRDFALNAIAVPLAGGEPLDPYGGRADLESGTIAAVSDTVFTDDPHRLLRAVRLEAELGFALDGRTEALLREAAGRVADPSGERILAELLRLPAAGYRRLDELGLLAPLGGSLAGPLDAHDHPWFRLVAVLGAEVERLPVSNELRRYARILLAAGPPEDGSPRSIHRFRRRTEPWALEALAFAGASEHGPAVEAARAADPAEPLVRGDELGLPPGPEIGRVLASIEEERAAGTIATREDALALARRLAGENAGDGPG
jgi:Poly A polymerase head domain/Probable RNA and SrmB- binding site of polymerase A